MRAEGLREILADFIEDELEMDVQLQGKRIVADDGAKRFVILVTEYPKDGES